MDKRIRKVTAWDMVKKFSRDMDRLYDLERKRLEGQVLTVEENAERLKLRARRSVVEFRVY